MPRNPTNAFDAFLADTVQHTRKAVKGRQTVYIGRNKIASDTRQKWIVAECDDALSPRLWVFARKSVALRAAKFAAENPHASALSVLEAP